MKLEFYQHGWRDHSTISCVDSGQHKECLRAYPLKALKPNDLLNGIQVDLRAFVDLIQCMGPNQIEPEIKEELYNMVMDLESRIEMVITQHKD
ncbi:MAG: hypothetical protein JRJ42_09325 [Deltaproteobacteria bacterium]|nr:hypothetical protein [Deltaproteobacteria bacterium]